MKESVLSKRRTQGKSVRVKGGIGGVFALAWPSVLSGFLWSASQLYAFWILKFISTDAVVGLTVGGRIWFLLISVLIALGVGAAALVARAWGMGSTSEASRVAWTSVYLSVGVSILCSIFLYVFAEPLATVLLGTASPSSIRESGDYLRWVAPWFVFGGLNFVLSQVLRAAGNVREPLFAAVIIGAASALLTPPLVFGWWFDIPPLGLRGVALATGLALMISDLYLIIAWARGWAHIPFGAPPNPFSFRTRKMLQIAIPASGEQAAVQLGLIFFTALLGRQGIEAFAAYGIGVQILSFSFLCGVGLSIASSTLVGQAMGASDLEGAKREGWRSTAMAVVVMSFLGGILVLFRNPISAWLAPSPEVAELTALFIIFLGCMQPFMAVEFAVSGGLRGAGDTRAPFFITTTGMVFVRLTLAGTAWLLDLGTAWIYASLLGDYLVKAGLYIYWFHKGNWQRRAW